MSKAPKSRNRLTVTTEEGKIELTEKELRRVAGGVDSESADSKHKGFLFSDVFPKPR